MNLLIITSDLTLDKPQNVENPKAKRLIEIINDQPQSSFEFKMFNGDHTDSGLLHTFYIDYPWSGVVPIDNEHLRLRSVKYRCASGDIEVNYNFVKQINDIDSTEIMVLKAFLGDYGDRLIFTSIANEQDGKNQSSWYLKHKINS